MTQCGNCKNTILRLHQKLFNTFQPIQFYVNKQQSQKKAIRKQMEEFPSQVIVNFESYFVH